MNPFEKKKVEEAVDVETTEVIDEETTEEDTDMKPKKNWKKILKWGAIGVGTVVGGVVAIATAKKNHDDALAALYLNELSGDDEESDEDGDETEENEKTTEE